MALPRLVPGTVPAPLALAIQEAAEKCEFWIRSRIWFSEASILKVELLHKVSYPHVGPGGLWLLFTLGCAGL